MTTWAFFADAGLTMPLVIKPVAVVDGSGYTDTAIYFGSPEAGKTLEAASDPGTDPISVSIDDTEAVGITAAAVKLALSAPGLASATAGAPVNLPATLASGTGGLVVLFMRVSEGALANANYTGLKLKTASIVES